MHNYGKFRPGLLPAPSTPGGPGGARPEIAMSFLLQCPNCGKRPVGEFAFKGEYKRRPTQADPFEAWTDYVFMAENRQGAQIEWWQHRSGCQRWFLVERDTTDNTAHKSFWFEERERHAGS